MDYPVQQAGWNTYKLQCVDCSALYIGEIGGQLCVRVQEQLDEVKSNASTTSSAFANRLTRSGHRFELDQAIDLSIMKIPIAKVLFWNI